MKLYILKEKPVTVNYPIKIYKISYIVIFKVLLLGPIKILRLGA